MMKNEKGITLASLVIMIIVLMILASIATYSGTSTLRYVKYNKAKAEIQTIQAQVNKWNEEYKNGNEEVLTYGNNISENSTKINDAIITTFENVGITDNSLKADYRYFSEQYLKEKIGLDASYDYLVNVKGRDTILVEGINYNNKKYFTLKDFEIINVEENLPDSISFKLDQGENTEIIISDLKLNTEQQGENQGLDLSKFIVQYTKSGENDWIDATKDVVKFVDQEDKNKIKYKFSVPEITDSSIINVEYDIKILTSDGKISNIIKNKKIESNNYIKNGLVLHLDGINNTGNGHENTATTWKDLSGTSEDAILNNVSTTAASDSGWGDNYLALDGVDDYVTGLAQTNGDITVEFVGKTMNTNRAVIYMINYWSGSATSPTMQLWNDLTNEVFPRMLVPKTEDDTYLEIGKTQFDSVINPKTSLYTITKDNNAIKYIVNGDLIKEYNETQFMNRFNITDLNFTIGKWHKGSSHLSKQNVNAYRIYNRALTNEEAIHNYRIDKYRFNIK